MCEKDSAFPPRQLTAQTAYVDFRRIPIEKQNRDALEELLTPRTSVLMLAHLSSECNCPELVRNLFETKLRELGRTDLRFEVLSQERPVGPVDLFDHMVAEEYGYAAN